MRRRELVGNLALAGAATLATAGLVLLLLRTLAPRLVGRPVEVELVQSSEQVPPYHPHVFEGAGTNADLPDPLTMYRQPGLQRRRPGLGPTDLIGFRNEGVPNAPLVVVVGDSQTYGVGVGLEESWPQQLAAALGARPADVYSMACPGWGPTQYVSMARLAGRFRPRAVVVAYYTGNDPNDAFSQAYANPHWSRLRPDPALTRSDGPRIPAAPEKGWAVTFADGVHTVFTPLYRLATNDRSQAGVRVGYQVTARTARLVASSLEGSPTRPVFTVIPTKEMAYATKVQVEGLPAPEAYRALVRDEGANLAELAERLGRAGAYVDLLGPLQEAARRGEALYRTDADGHPAPSGHAVIGRTIAAALRSLGLATRGPAEASPAATASPGD